MDKKKALGRDPFLSWIKSTQSGQTRNPGPAVGGTMSSSASGDPSSPEISHAMSTDETQNRSAPVAPLSARPGAPVRSWPFVAIISCDMLLLLLLGYFAYADLSKRFEAVNRKVELTAAQVDMLKDRIDQLERGQQFDQIAPPRGRSGTNKPAPKR